MNQKRAAVLVEVAQDHLELIERVHKEFGGKTEFATQRYAAKKEMLLDIIKRLTIFDKTLSDSQVEELIAQSQEEMGRLRWTLERWGER